MKDSLGSQRIEKCFITGVSPLSMTDFNIATNVSFEKELAGLCGLSYEDVYAALQLPGMCGSDATEVQKHFDIMLTASISSTSSSG